MIRVSRCAVWNDKVRCFGIAAESRNDITDVRFEDCDVLRSYADWTTELGSLVVYICDRGRVSDITFENIGLPNFGTFRWMWWDLQYRTFSRAGYHV